MPKDMTPAETAIEAFGDMAKLGRAAGVSRSAVLLWKRRGHIPAKRQRTILSKARELGLILSTDDLILGRTAEE